MVDLIHLVLVNVLVIILEHIVSVIEVKNLCSDVVLVVVVDVLSLALRLLSHLHVLGIFPVGAFLRVLEDVLLFAEHLVEVLNCESFSHVQNPLVLNSSRVALERRDRLHFANLPLQQLWL